MKLKWNRNMAKIDPSLDNTYCVYAFSELALKQWNGNVRNATPCCNMIRPGNDDPMDIKKDLEDGNLSIDEIFNHPNFQKMRREMLLGKKPKPCEGCFKSEELYKTSYRINSHGYNRFFDDIDQDNPSLQILDLSTGDSCNLRCRMCHPGTSNQLRIDSKMFRDRGFDYNKNQPGWWDINEFTEKNSENKGYFSPGINSNQWEDLKKHLSTVKIIKASGGETLMSRAFIDFLDYAIDHGYSKNIHLHFHTNATKFNRTMMKRFEKFKEVAPDISLDGIGKTFEYIRYPAKFEEIEQNLNKFFSGNFEAKTLSVNFVLMSYNIHNLKDTIEWLLEYSNSRNLILKLNADQVFPIGRNIDIKWLPPEMLQEVLDEIQIYEEWDVRPPLIKIRKNINYIRECIENYEYNPEMLKRFKEETVQFDAIRNQSYRDYCDPRLVKLLDSIEL